MYWFVLIIYNIVLLIFYTTNLHWSNHIFYQLGNINFHIYSMILLDIKITEHKAGIIYAWGISDLWPFRGNSWNRTKFPRQYKTIIKSDPVLYLSTGHSYYVTIIFYIEYITKQISITMEPWIFSISIS